MNGASQIHLPRLSGAATRFLQTQNMSRHAMSSREIAELTGKSHDNVLRDARQLVAGGVLKTEETPYVHPQNGQTYPEFLLDERDSLVLVSGYDAALRAKIIDRWIELETKPAFDYAAALSDPRTLLALLTENVTKVVSLEADNIELSKENHELEVKVGQDAPKVAFHDMVAVSHKTYNAAQAAKIIGTGRTRLLQFMRQKGWVTRSNEPYQVKIEAGLLDVKLGTFEHPTQGTIPTCSTLITGKGLTKLQGLWEGREADLLGG